MRLLLVGCGHAHLEVLRRMARRPLPGVALTAVSPSRLHFYSGMVPGYLQGTYGEGDVAVDLGRLVRRAGGRLVIGRAVALDTVRRVVRCEGHMGCELPYDLVSFAVGSNTAGANCPEVAAHAQLIKPIGRVVELRQRLRELAAGPRAGARVVVVGGGAGGVEIVLAMARVLADAVGAVALVEAGPDILSGYPPRFRRRARTLLAAHGIAVRTGLRVEAVEEDAVRLEGGAKVPSRLTVWITGPAAWPLFRGSGLPLDARGFLLVDAALRSPADPRVFAAGDCGTLQEHPDTPKAGVYAVREGPILWQSLRAAARGAAREAPVYRPQRSFLSILNTADGRALLRYRGLVSYGRWAWRLKDAIDRSFMARYR